MVLLFHPYSVVYAMVIHMYADDNTAFLAFVRSRSRLIRNAFSKEFPRFSNADEMRNFGGIEKRYAI